MTEAGGTPRACQSCPSFLKREEAPTFFKKSVGAPMCARFGLVLGKPGLKPAGELAIGRAFAESCADFGNPKPASAPDRPNLQVAVGDPEVLMAGFPSEEEREKVSSCLGCKNFITDRAVVADLGWPSGMCAATGRLILSHRASQEARNCSWRAPGPNRESTAGVILKPVYEDAFGIAADPMVKLLKSVGTVVEPSTYPTDREVTDDDTAAGIRAWRKIDDPNGSGRHTFLPIFNIEFFDPDEREKIPRTGDDEAPEQYIDHMGAVYKAAVLMQELDETPALWGPAGTGKTEFGRHLAWLMCMPFDRLSITDSSDVDDLAGSMRARTDGHGGTETYFHYGRLVNRWQKPGILLLDEPNTGPDAVWQFVRPLTDNSKQLVLDQNRGERIARHDSCYFLMAMNPAWDIRNVGARPLADADGNRLAHLLFKLPPEPLERAILEARCEADGYEVTKDTLDAVMRIAADIRRASDDGTLPISWGIRPQIKVTRATRWFDLLTCYQVAVTDYLDPEQAAFVLQIVRDHVGDPDAAF
jgi:MoxR-like ATPase